MIMQELQRLRDQVELLLHENKVLVSNNDSTENSNSILRERQTSLQRYVQTL